MNSPHANATQVPGPPAFVTDIRFSAATGSSVRPQRGPALALAAAGALAIVALTAVPSGGGAEQSSPWCVVCGPYGGVDFALNLVLYIPLGLGLGALRLRPRTAVAAVFLTSLVVEVLQVGVISGRDANLGDLVSNTIGGLIGVWIGTRWRSLVQPRARESLRLARAWGLLWLVIVAISTWAVGVNIPEPPWWAQLALKGTAPQTFRGEVLETSIGGIPVRSDSLVNGAALRTALLNGAPATVRAIVPKPSVAPSSVFGIADSTEVSIFTLAQDGHDGVFHVQTRAGGVLRLQSPSIRLPGAFPSSGEDTVRLTGQRTRTSLSIAAERGDGRVARTLRVSPHWAWTFFLPFEYSLGPGSWRATALWLAALALPLGYWLGRAGQLGGAAVGPAVVALLASIAAGGLWAVPRLGGLQPSGPTEWCAWGLGAAAGVLAGWLSGRLSRTPPDAPDLPESLNWNPTGKLV